MDKGWTYRNSKLNKLITKGDIKLMNLLGKTSSLQTGAAYVDNEGYHRITPPGRRAFKGVNTGIGKKLIKGKCGGGFQCGGSFAVGPNKVL